MKLTEGFLTTCASSQSGNLVRPGGFLVRLFLTSASLDSRVEHAQIRRDVASDVCQPLLSEGLPEPATEIDAIPEKRDDTAETRKRERELWLREIEEIARQCGVQHEKVVRPLPGE